MTIPPRPLHPETTAQTLERWLSDGTTWIGVFENYDLGHVDLGRRVALPYDVSQLDGAQLGVTTPACGPSPRIRIQAGKLHAKPHIPMLRENNTRRGFFEHEQFEAVRTRLPEALRPVATFAYITGWRVRSEVLGLEWRQVDWDGKVVRLDPGTTKNREGRSFPFTAALEALLKAQFAEHERLKKEGRVVRWVFFRMKGPKKGPKVPAMIRNFRRAWVSACKAAGVPGRLVHDFRRTAVRNLERAGVSRSAAMTMVGHKTESIYRGYAIVDAGALRDAASKLDRATGICAFRSS